jgi:hypothetical protein
LKTIIIFLITITSYGQSLTVECGQNNTISRDVVRVIDTLTFTCARTLLVEDNSVIYIYNVNGIGNIVRSGVAGVKYNAEGLDRIEGDCNPTVILMSNFSNLTINENIDVVYFND